jgi:hypothetical protein
VALSLCGALRLECSPNGLGSPGGSENLAKRSRAPPTTAGAPRQTAGRRPRPDVVHSSLYLPEAVYEALRESAFRERCKIHDLVMQGIEMALKKRGYPPVEELKAGKKR